MEIGKVENRIDLGMSSSAQSVRAAQLILESVGEDPTREGLLKTPIRYARSLAAMTAGYQLTPKEAAGQGIFEAESSGLVSVQDIEFYSMCEHHLVPFWGKASVAYYPNEKILGLSKIPRILDVFAKRFQVQERITRQVAEAVVELILPRAVFVRIDSFHMCMMMRGVEKQSAKTITEFSLGESDLTPQEVSRAWASLVSNPALKP